MKCTNCGREIEKERKFCKYCGQPVKQATNNNNSKKYNKYKKNKSKKGIVIFIAILVVLTISGAFLSLIYFANQNKKDKDKENMIIEESLEVDEEVVDEDDDYEDPEEYYQIDMDSVVVSCSSSLPEPQYNVYHVAENLIDSDTGTAWVEGVEGQGIGEFVTFTFKEKGLISEISIYNGYQKTEDIYNKNSRPKDITINFGDGSVTKVTLLDSRGEQVITLEHPVVAKSATVTVDSVYEGYKYADTAISEIYFY